MNLDILASDQYVYKGDGSYTYFLRVGGYVFFWCKILRCCEFLWKRECSDEKFFKFKKKKRIFCCEILWIYEKKGIFCYEILWILKKEWEYSVAIFFWQTCKRWCAKAFDLLLFEKISRAPCGKRILSQENNYWASFEEDNIMNCHSTKQKHLVFAFLSHQSYWFHDHWKCETLELSTKSPSLHLLFGPAFTHYPLFLW